jgi:hypothetical protein
MSLAVEYVGPTRTMLTARTASRRIHINARYGQDIKDSVLLVPLHQNVICVTILSQERLRILPLRRHVVAVKQQSGCASAVGPAWQIETTHIASYGSG